LPIKKKEAAPEVPEGLTVEEFMNLSSERPVNRGKPTHELLVFLTKPRSIKAIADYLGVTTSAAYSRMRRLLKAGKVQVRYSEKSAYWLSTGTE